MLKRLSGLKRVPGRAERYVSLASVGVLLASLLWVMAVSRHELERTEDLWRAKVLVQRAEIQRINLERGQEQSRQEAYIEFLEEHLSRYEDGNPFVWRPFALRRAEVIKRETEEERAARLSWEMRENGYLPPGP